MSLDLAHCWYVALADLVVILHVVLQRLVVIILHLFLGHRIHLAKLVCLVVCLCHSYLVLGVKRQLRMGTF